MRLMIVVYDQGVDESVMDTLEALELSGWTKLTDADGLGGAGKKLGDPVWPGKNNLLYLELADEQVGEVARAFREIQAEFRLKPGITLWSLPVDVL